MKNPSFQFPEPDHFTAGTVGDPGERTFFLQGRSDGAVTTFKCEKEHVRALGESLERVLGQLPFAPIDPLPEDLELLVPIEPEWVVGSMGLAFDEERDRIVIILEELEGEASDEDDDAETAQARLSLTRAQAAAFINRSHQLLEAGRPPCILCQRPLDSRGHTCPATNGHTPRHN